MPVDNPLSAAIRLAAVDLPAGQLQKLAALIAKYDAPSAAARYAILKAVPTPVFRHHVSAICDAWGAVGVTGAGIALAVASAAAAVEDVRGEQQVSVAWTGPASYEVPVRSTSAVLEEVIDEAKKNLTVVSFAAYKVPAVVEALKRATDRGVIVRLVLESVAESKGKLSHEAKEAFATLGETVAYFVWPSKLRVTAAGGQASMHVKCAIADRRIAFVTSANLTGAAMTHNMELGLVVRGGDAPKRIADHFIQLMGSGVLVELTDG